MRSRTNALSSSRSDPVRGGCLKHSLAKNIGPIWTSGQAEIRQAAVTNRYRVSSLLTSRKTPAQPDRGRRGGGMWPSRSTVGEGPLVSLMGARRRRWER